jgi:hypothetical protein
VQDGINKAKTDIESLKNDLLPKAKDIVLLKKSASALGAVAEIFPVGQPYVGLTGNVISQLPDVDPNEPWEENALIIGANVAGDFAESKVQNATTAWKVESGEIDLEDLENQKNQEQIEKLNALRQPIMDLLGESLNQIQGSQSPSPDVEAELQRLLADAPEHKELVKQIKELNRQKQEFAARLAELLQKVTTLSLAISRNLITIDALNRNIQEQNLVLDPATVNYLEAMNQRARERLLKYHYFTAKAFEYRMLQPYPGEIDLTKIFDKFKELADAGKGYDLSASDFEALRAVYEDQISSVVFKILEDYNSNRPTLSAPVGYWVRQELLDKLNNGDTAIFNLYDEDLFFPDEENLRIVDLRVTELQVEYVGDPSDVIAAEVRFQHSGHSVLVRDGEFYSFRHYNDNTRSKIEWVSRYSPSTDAIQPVVPSAAEESLLKALLTQGGSGPSTEDLLIYSRPAARGDLFVTRQINARSGADMKISGMRIELLYDFSRKNDQMKSLKVVADTEGAQPYVKVSQVDLNNRKDGEGSFERTFDVGTAVIIEVPQKMGAFAFDRWEGKGLLDPNSPVTTLLLNDDVRLTPIYRLASSGDGLVFGLEDAILALAMISGVRPPRPIDSSADVNDDGKIGLEEVIYILQEVSSLRQ